MRLSIIFCLFLVNTNLSAKYFQQNVKYNIDVTLNVEEKTYNGIEIITYKNNSNQTLEYIWFHFYPNAYKNNTTKFAKQMELFQKTRFHFSKQDERGYLDLISAKANSKILKWEYKENCIDEIKIYLNEPLKSGEKTTLELQFAGKFPKMFSRSGYFGDNYFVASQWYPKVVVFDKFGWHPDSYLHYGEFYGEFGNYDVSITLPKNYVIDATGMLVNNSEEEKFINDIVEQTKKCVQLESEKERKEFIKKWNEDIAKRSDLTETKTVHFTAKNVHDFAWFTGEDYMIYQTKHNNGVLTNVLVQPKNAYSWRNAAKYVEQAIWFYGKEVGKYQYPKASVVDGIIGANGGMEYPMITIINFPNLEFNNLFEIVIAHEVGHNWFYGMLGSNERKEMFLDEGLNSYYEQKYMEHFYGFNNMFYFDKLLKVDLLDNLGEWYYTHIAYGIPVANQTDQPMDIGAGDFTPYNYSISFYKGRMMLETLRWMIGDDTFKKGITQYFNKWAGKHPTVDDFFSIMSQVSNNNLDKFYDEWFTKITYNDFTIKKKKTKHIKTGYETEIYIKNKGTMKGMPAPVSLITEKGDTLEGRWQGIEKQPVIIKHTSKRKHVAVNLDKKIFETNYLNNSPLPDIAFNFLFELPKFDKYLISYYPYYWFEEYEDKNRVGLAISTGNAITNQYVSKGSFYYATGSGKWGYNLGYSHRFLGCLFNFSDISAYVKDKSGLRNVGTNIKTVYINRSDDRFKMKFNLGFDVIHLHDINYLDANIFESSRYSTISFGSEFILRRMLHRFNANFDVEKAIDISDFQADYLKISLSSNYRYQFSKRLFGTIRTFGGGIIGDELPRQERIYLGGDVDPKHQRFAFSRKGGMAPLRTWTYISGMNMFGYGRMNGHYSSGKAGASATLEIRYRRFLLPSLYLSSGTISEKIDDFGSDDLVHELGFKFNLPFVTFILPFYISDPCSGEDNFDFRFLMNINISKYFKLSP